MNRRNKPKAATPTMDAIVAHGRAIPGSIRTQAKALGLSLDMWNRLRNGDRTQAMEDLDRMAKALGLSIVVFTRDDCLRLSDAIHEGIGTADAAIARIDATLTHSEPQDLTR